MLNESQKESNVLQLIEGKECKLTASTLERHGQGRKRSCSQSQDREAPSHSIQAPGQTCPPQLLKPGLGCSPASSFLTVLKGDIMMPGWQE
ncbi:hypothetical protein CK820_G0036038 [Pan troglodytes]|uniref:Uncharacterized protein n=1 Tax=Pan troglodytes TaxID=9598 RepID=A0A2J8KU56_PANTR|nr:hypothetical protein CK820_G0036038 [Pan troglodytes]